MLIAASLLFDAGDWMVAMRELRFLIASVGAVFSASTAQAAFVQFSVPADADVVAESAAAAPSGIDGGGRAFMSATQAAARAAVGQVGNGLPDNGQFIDVSTGGIIHLLPYTGNNVVRRNATNNTAWNATFTPDKFLSLTIFATSGDAAGTLTLGLNY